MPSINNYLLVLSLSLISYASYPVYAETEDVIIPFGASNQNNPFSLSPSVIDVGVNDTVTWKNNDSSMHTVTTGSPSLGYDGRIDSGPIAPGNTFSYKFNKAGVYGYYCLFHPWMTGVVNVGSGKAIEPVIDISISTDKAMYQKDDTISIFGNVSQFIPNNIVTIWVTDSQGKGIVQRHVETEDGNNFTTSISTTNSLWISGNSYKVFAQYGSRSSVSYTTIQLEGNKPSGSIYPVNNTTSTTTQSYMTAHEIHSPDSDKYMTTQTDHNMYKPQDQVKIYGSVWDGLFSKLGGAAYIVTVPVSSPNGIIITELVNINIKNSTGEIISNKEIQVNNTGDYQISISLPKNANGQYVVESMVETKAGLLNTLDPSVMTKLGSSTSFVVTNPVEYQVNTKKGVFNVEISSNSTVTGFEFKPENKEISFTVQGKTGTRGVTEITIPKTVLSGQIQVLIDGKIQTYDSDNVIVTSDIFSETTLEINYPHSMHAIKITGTRAAEPVQVSQEIPQSQAVPEFSSMTPIVLALSIISILIASIKMRTGLGTKI